MERHLSRSFLGRWPARRLQARRLSLPIALSVAVATGGCGAGGAEARAPRSRVPPDEIIVRTEHVAFHMGARVDPTWPAKAEETRVALGQAAEALLDDDGNAMEVLTRQLGVSWPEGTLDYDVALRPDGAALCGEALPRRLDVAPKGDAPDLFFACVLERTLARLEAESSLARTLGSSHYPCVVRYAVSALLVARLARANARMARTIEVRLADACGPEELDWLGKEWVKRVREDETAESFGARLARELPRPEGS
jgi:hypothetical protein